ncbi:MAG: hypothetical protein Q4B40_03190, partial [Clostridia bacterium]|nr:hypothetical protein [Clostridia bacterium]
MKRNTALIKVIDMFKRIFAIVLVLIMSLSFGGCGEKYKLPEYSQKQFSTSGFWAPYDISEEGLQLYKDAGLNTLLMVNHSLDKDSGEKQFYLGSERTMKALELCKKLELNAVIQYADWIAEWVEGEGYYSDTPFSQFDIYDKYKDIITGVSICDEPKADSLEHYANKTKVEDFKKVYPNATFQGNLIPITAGSHNWGYQTYEIMLDMFAEKFMEPFDNPYISVDVYPFHLQVPDSDLYYAANYEMIAKNAKEYSAETTFILQSSTGNEFESELSEGDMRWQINSAIAYGADNLQYYCYAVPQSFKEDGTTDEAMYNYCILNPDNTPSQLYYYLQTIHKEIQGYASVALSYDWDSVKGIEGSKESAYRV